MAAGFTHKVEGDKLTITVDLKSDLGPSKSGKTNVIATSHGNMDVGNSVKLGLNVYRPKQ